MEKEKRIDTNGITYIVPLSGASNEWYFGLDFEHGDLYEAEELFKGGYIVKGRKLCLIHYPDGAAYYPVPKTEGCYSERPVYLDGGIYIINAIFTKDLIQIIRFDCAEHTVKVHAELSLSSVKDCYNLSLQTAPLTLTRQCAGSREFEIVWPEKVSFEMDDHDSFFLRDGNRLFFNRWFEEFDGDDYIYREETIIKDLSGNIVETLPGDVMLMPNGERWNLK